ncbi:MAG: hypothetical protein AB1631_32010, partial [Acidobacteriota bacterium]
MFSMTRAAAIAMIFMACLARIVVSGQSTPPCAKIEIRLAEKSPAKGLTEITVPRSKEKLYLHREAI